MRFLIPGLASTVVIGGKPALVADSVMNSDGGMIVNPLSRLDQQIAATEALYVDLVSPASLIGIGGTTVEVLPGQTFIVPPNTNVWVNAQTSGHAFTAVFSRTYQVGPPAIVPGTPESGVGVGGYGKPFPAFAPTGLTKVIPSYLYQEYSDDDDLQGFCQAQNDMQQNYVDTFNELNLPIYTGPIVAGALLDWVARGVYGMARPSIGVGRPVQIGPLNTWGPAMLPAINEIIQISPGNVIVTDDDLFRRILTWHFFKGDGNYFGARWMKRRIWRFLFGVNGVSVDFAHDPNSDYAHVPGRADSSDAFIADTEQISVSLGANRNVTIRFVLGKRTVTGGSMLNMFGPNGFGPHVSLTSQPNHVDIQLNDIQTTYVKYPPLPYMTEFKAALESGVLETPYQFNFTCTIG